ncbi:2OG-Fe(II) oxygenase (plasmid) [Polaromonas sp. P1-6]|nr:2OG-Fe(II) oxygenase [Polaromonas sp. P1-6]
MEKYPYATIQRCSNSRKPAQVRQLPRRRYLAKAAFLFQKTAAFRYGWFADPSVSEFSHWHIDFLNKSGADQTNHENLLYANPACAVIAEVWTALKAFHLNGHSLVRCYANAHTYGVEGAPHTDSSLDSNFTTIIYIVPEWKAEWAGETAFFNAEGDIVSSVLPKPNRMITFDGTQLHAARALARICPALRVTLMFKTKAPDAVTA